MLTRGQRICPPYGVNTVATYGYDYAGRRVSKTLDGVVTWYVYDGIHVVAEYTNYVLVRKYVYGPGIDQPVAMINVAGTAESCYYDVVSLDCSFERGEI